MLDTGLVLRDTRLQRHISSTQQSFDRHLMKKPSCSGVSSYGFLQASLSNLFTLDHLMMQISLEYIECLLEGLFCFVFVFAVTVFQYILLKTSY